MDQTRINTIIEAYGADPSRWPDDERQAAQAFIAANPDQFHNRLEQEARLDQALDTLIGSAQVSDKLQSRLKASLIKDVSVQTKHPSGPSGIPSWAGMAAAIALTAGLGVGWIGADFIPSNPTSELDEGYYSDAFSAINSDAVWQLEETQ